jgi:hypothetical protein
MGIYMRKFIWSNHLGLLLRGSIEVVSVSYNRFVGEDFFLRRGELEAEIEGTVVERGRPEYRVFSQGSQLA